MARSLVRLVFPRFVARMAIVILAIAFVAFALSTHVQRTSDAQARTRELRLIAIALATIESPTAAREFLARAAENDGAALLTFDAEGVLIDRYLLPDAAVPVGRVIVPESTTTAFQIRVDSQRQTGIAIGIASAVVPGVAAVGRVESVDRLALATIPFAAWLGASILLILAAILVLAYRLIEEIGRPLALLQVAAARFADGDLSYRCIVPEPKEFVRLAETMNGMAQSLRGRIDAIRSQRAQLEAILGSMTEGVLLVDAQFRVRSMNAAAQRLFDVEEPIRTDGSHRSLLEVIRNSDIHEVTEQTLRSGVGLERTIIIYTAPPRYMQIHGTIVDLDSDRAALIVLNDVTRLNELERVRKEFVANVSHELRTPITSILGFVETLQDGALDDPDEARHFLDIIASQTGRLNAIIEDLLQLSRLEQHRIDIRREEIDPLDLLESVRITVTPRLAERSVDLVVERRGQAPLVANRTLVEQAIVNLVDNAAKYGPAHSRVTVMIESAPHGAAIHVHDLGGLIDPADLPRLFERFYRTDRARSRSLGGTGLGLAIVKHIAQAHGGAVTATSSRIEGTRFSMTIPAPRSDERSDHHAPAQAVTDRPVAELSAQRQ